ncbi:hypothetical protein RIF29_37552 [Crotalaria pallida]|uniref:Angio-associated migratory cell protein n=1 Tax=Crotalaria pallida TaxID=3830 RepID=A0AAN9EEI2_CROPI
MPSAFRQPGLTTYIISASHRWCGWKANWIIANTTMTMSMGGQYEYEYEYDDDDDGEFVIDESDIVHELSMDDEDLPNADSDSDSDQDIVDVDVDDAIHTFTGHTDELYSVACSPTHATLVATGGADDRGFLWEIGQQQGYQPVKLEGHQNSVTGLAFSYDGKFLASGCLEGIVHVWDASTSLGAIVKVWDSSAYMEEHTQDHMEDTQDHVEDTQDLEEDTDTDTEKPKRGIEWLKWHPRQHKLLAAFEDSNVWMWNKDNEISPLTYLTGHGGPVTCGDFTPDGGKICTGSADKTLRIWNSNGEIIKVVKGHGYHTEGLTCLAISSNSALALTGSEDGSACFVNIDKGRVISSMASRPYSIECVGFSPSDASFAAIGGMDKSLIIWDIRHSLSQATCDHKAGVTCLAWVGSRCVATGCEDGTVKLWDIRSGESVETFRGHSGGIQSLSVSANGDYIVSASLDHTARVFDVRKFSEQN